MDKRIIVKADLCNGCGICQLVCASVKEKQWHPALSRIKLRQNIAPGLNSALMCVHCEEPVCAEVCVMNVIYQDINTGLVLRDEESCIGCRACEIACPFSAVSYNQMREIALTCDLCAGNPRCVEYCPCNAMMFVASEEMVYIKRHEFARQKLMTSGDVI